MTDIGTIQNIKASMTSISEQLRRLEEEYQRNASELFGKESAFLFEKHPKLESFGWTQYTPYFNDGEECTFSAYTDEPSINGSDIYDGEFWDTIDKTTRVQKPGTDYRTPYADRYESVENPKYDPDNEALYDDVKQFLKQFTDDSLQRLFGDHVEVTVTRKGVETEDYDHD